MITSPDPSPRSAAVRWLTIGGIVVLLVVVAAGFVSWRQRVQRLAHLEASQKSIHAIVLRANRIIDRLDADEEKAEKAGTKRHDEDVAGDTIETELKYAKIEQAGESSASKLDGASGKAILDMADAYSSLLGYNTQHLRDLQSVASDTCANYFADWDRAIGDIVDNDQMQINGQEAGDISHVEEYYHDTDHDEVICARRNLAVSQETAVLEHHLDADIAGARAAARRPF